MYKTWSWFFDSSNQSMCESRSISKPWIVNEYRESNYFQRCRDGGGTCRSYNLQRGSAKGCGLSEEINCVTRVLNEPFILHAIYYLHET